MNILASIFYNPPLGDIDIRFKEDYNLDAMPDDLKVTAINRLKRARGHLKSVEKMIAEDKYCIDILQQSLAVQNALKAVDQLIMERHLYTCVSDAVKKEGEAKEKAIREILAIFEKKRR